MMVKAIEIKNMSANYDNVTALSNINLTVEEGDFLGIIGPNGGGKSTLLKVILGLVKPSSGTVKIFGVSPTENAVSIGYVPQFSTFDKNFPISVEDVILIGRLRPDSAFFHKYSAEDRKTAEAIMQKLELSHLRKRQIGMLSGGQLQRVLIARALAVKPSIIVLDEPTASVDNTSTLHIYDILKELNKDITIILASHDMGAISSFVKNIACLNTSLYYHGEPSLSLEIVEKVYGCPVDLITHGDIPHRVLHEHGEHGHKGDGNA